MSKPTVRKGGAVPGFVSLLVTGSLHLCLGTMSQLKQEAEEDWEREPH